MERDNVDLLVERLYALVDNLKDPEYVRRQGVVDKSALFANRANADQILFAMFGGVSGSDLVPPALDRGRERR